MNKILFLLLTLTACSSKITKIDAPAGKPVPDQVSELEAKLNKAQASPIQVLAPDELAKSQSYFAQAKHELEKKSDPQDSLGFARAYLEEAHQIARQRKLQAEDVLQARHHALHEGARRVTGSAATLASLDRIFSRNAQDLSRPPRNTVIWNQLAKDYQNLELATIQQARLGKVKDVIHECRRNNARRLAPQILHEAEDTFDSADKQIAMHPHEPKAYEPAVKLAAQKASLLEAVTKAANATSDSTTEEVARAMVAKNNTLGTLQKELSGAELEADVKGHALAAQSKELTELEKDKKLNDSLEQARTSFGPQEAEVYRQGNRLLIRLKQMDFAPGRSDLPAQALPLLTKVRTVIQNLKAEDIVVEGHTDSNGGPQLNRSLSQRRAEAVADYFENANHTVKVEAVGYGYEKPLTSNKTAVGRAENRRVDVVITPSAQL